MEVIQLNTPEADQNDADHRALPATTSRSERTLTLARDSDAVPSVFPREQRILGVLLSTCSVTECSATCVLGYVLHVLGAAAGAFWLFAVPNGAAKVAGMEEPNALLYVTSAMSALAQPAMIPVIAAARVSLRPGGALEDLDAGKVLISEQDAQTLSRWRWFLAAMSGLSVLVGLFCVVEGPLSPLGIMPPDAPVALRVTWVLVGLEFITFGPIALIGWFASMDTASRLCRDQAVEAVRAVSEADPTDDSAWKKSVEAPAMALRHKFEVLSDGWGDGLLGIGIFSWSSAAALLSSSMNQPLMAGLDAASQLEPGTWRITCFVFMVIFVFLPFLLAKDIADTSTWCSYLMAELNDVRTRCMTTETHLKVQMLEVALERLVRQKAVASSLSLVCVCVCVHLTMSSVIAMAGWQNFGQGLGFVVSRVVINKRLLKTSAVKLSSGLTSFVTIVLAVLETQQSVAGGEEACALSEVQTSTIRAVMGGGNSTCAYDMSLASIIGT
jgi:hypothetical protein